MYLTQFSGLHTELGEKQSIDPIALVTTWYQYSWYRMLPIFGSIYSFLLDIQHTHIQTGKRRTMWKMLRVYTDKTNRPLNSSGLSLFKSFLLYVSFFFIVSSLPPPFASCISWMRLLASGLREATAANHLRKNSPGKANYTQTKHFACYCVRDSCLIDWMGSNEAGEQRAGMEETLFHFPDGLIHPRPHIHKPGTHTHLLVIPTEQRWTISLACTWRNTYSRDKTTKQLKCACECV